MAGVQARLTIPVLLVTLAVTPPFLLQMTPLDPALGPRGAGRMPQLPPWQVSSTLESAGGREHVCLQGMAHAGSVAPLLLHASSLLLQEAQRHDSCMIDGPIETLLLRYLLFGLSCSLRVPVSVV